MMRQRRLSLNITIDENPEKDTILGKMNGSSNTGTVSYTINNQKPTGALSINASSGELTVKDESLFDYEANPIITATVSAKQGNATKEATVKITLNDLDVPKNGLLLRYFYKNL